MEKGLQPRGLKTMRRSFQLAIALLWLALPVVAYQYWRVWNQLPARMASHFNAAGQPNGWMSREVSAEFGICVIALLLVVFTIILWVMLRSQIEKVAWMFLGFSAVILSLVAVLNQQVIAYNLNGTPLHIESFLITIPAVAIAFALVFLASKRGHPLPQSEVLAEETHSGRLWTLAFVPTLLMPLMTARVVPNNATRLPMILVSIITLALMAIVWTGFRYRFLQHGLEVRILGFRLRSIPRQQILSYAAESWSPLRGYGIRGLGNNRAFVWGNKVVHIRTTNGEVYLGHTDPERIVRDLDRVTKHNTMSSEPGFGKSAAQSAKS
jgi:uncharacterized protein DUF1648